MRADLKVFMVTSFRLILTIILLCESSFINAMESPAANKLKHLEINPHSKSLVVLIHAFTQNAESLQHVRATVKSIDLYREADILVPNLPFGLLSTAAPLDIVAELLHTIDVAWASRLSEGRPYESVVLIGHSMGSLFLRKVYIAAYGETPEAPLEQELKSKLASIGAQSVEKSRPWIASVDRIVLLAGLNRGWTISHHMSLMRGLQMWVGTLANRIFESLFGRQFIIFSARRGSPFITQLRLQWLAMRERTYTKDETILPRVKVIQLLGTVDDLVPPTDNVDSVTGRDFVYLEVPHSGHLNVIDMDNSPQGMLRASALKNALTLDNFDFLKINPPISETDESAILTDKHINDVVFVVHGIRDEGYWTHRIANRVASKGRGQHRVIAVETSSYGYFPILSFLRPSARNEKVEWLMDQYTIAKAKYPNAQFSFVGHSNGTYLLYKALKDYPAVKFKNVAFAGSVVQRDFPWSQYMPSRVEAVFNFVATKDWVVAWFPNAFQELGIQDLGSAGHDGFKEASWNKSVEEIKYVAGGHGAALEEVWWDSIAEFILSGKFGTPLDANTSASQVWWVRYTGVVAPLIWLLILLALGLIFYGIFKLKIREWKKTLLITTYFATIILVVMEL